MLTSAFVPTHLFQTPNYPPEPLLGMPPPIRTREKCIRSTSCQNISLDYSDSANAPRLFPTYQSYNLTFILIICQSPDEGLGPHQLKNWLVGAELRATAGSLRDGEVLAAALTAPELMAGMGVLLIKGDCMPVGALFPLAACALSANLTTRVFPGGTCHESSQGCQACPPQRDIKLMTRGDEMRPVINLSGLCAESSQ